MYKKSIAIRCKELLCIPLKLFLIMKLSFLLCFVSILQVSAAPSFAQKISLDKSNASLSETLKEIHQQSGFNIFYNAKMLKKAVPVNVHLQNTDLGEVLKQCFKDQPFGYIINNNTIVVIPKPIETRPVQDIIIVGQVKDEKGVSLPGVTIKVKGTNVGTQTGVDGSYKVSVTDNNAVLVFSFIGFVSQEIPVGNQTKIDVVLKEKTSALNEIVVVGYGTQKKVNLTGSVSSVTGETLNKRPVVNTASMLEGLAPGVQINTGSGEPGNESVSIRIRGNSTFSGAGSDPLVLIDGVPGNFSDLNPTDIDNVSILKDAASAAIYGSRAANGVVLITTKQGKAGQMSVTYNGNLGYASPTKMYKLVTNSAQYMEMFNQARINSGTTDPNSLYPQDQIDLYRNSTDRLHYPNTDWLSLIFRTAPTQNHNLVFTGGNEKTTYNVSLGYVNQE
ncbi:MAG: TonB-linked outer membrane protein SusC/RagA family, partial [Mucilaginibacter sp.]|nr:TonB-linked outer membrane protein SusC/RagA family [Mucilaginibacter sp.]